MKTGILEPSYFSQNVIDRLSDLGEVSLYHEGDIYDFISDKEVLYIRLKYLLDENFFARAKNLKFLCTPTTGLNHIDLTSASRNSVRVISLKGESQFLKNIRATPEHTLGLILSLLRNYKEAFLSVENPDWNREKFLGYELYKNKVGIIGLGRVGKILSGYLQAFGAQVYYNDILPIADNQLNNEEYLEKDKLINTCNIIVLCASYNQEAPFVISNDELDLMKGKFFVNTGRGELIDEPYLLSKIEERHFKGLAVDVIDRETNDNRLNEWLQKSSDQNIIVTPHIGGATYDSIHRTEMFVFKKLQKELL